MRAGTEKTGPAVALTDIGVRFDGAWVVRGFSLNLQPGEKVALAGPSGSGKSTVLKCVLGLVAPEKGTIHLFGQELDAQSVWQLRPRMAYVAQEPELGQGTAREAIERPFDYKANATLRENLARLPDLMERFRLPESILDKTMPTLSGGEKQRVALVSALLLDRELLLLDEASSALDPANKQAVTEYFSEAADQTVLAVSHDTEWQGFADRVVDLTQASSHGGEQP